MVQFRNRTHLQRRREWGGQLNLPDPYAPGGKGYAERTREMVTKLPGGSIRVDIGEPVARSPGEAQPVPRRSPSERPAVPATAPASEPEAPAAVRSAGLPDLKPGLGKHRRNADG